MSPLLFSFAFLLQFYLFHLLFVIWMYFMTYTLREINVDTEAWHSENHSLKKTI